MPQLAKDCCKPTIELVRRTDETANCPECGCRFIALSHWMAKQSRGPSAPIATADFIALGEAVAELFLQALNGVVCDPGQDEIGRHNCRACHNAWAKATDVLAKYDPHWGNMFRSGGSFQPQFGNSTAAEAYADFDAATAEAHADLAEASFKTWPED